MPFTSFGTAGKKANSPPTGKGSSLFTTKAMLRHNRIKRPCRKQFALVDGEMIDEEFSRLNWGGAVRVDQFPSPRGVLDPGYRDMRMEFAGFRTVGLQDFRDLGKLSDLPAGLLDADPQHGAVASAELTWPRYRKLEWRR